ncbi:MAG TPA: hypothetical protein VF702_13815 [Allosphingosinicella sp.]|jgi:hypothetical protein
MTDDERGLLVPACAAASLLVPTCGALAVLLISAASGAAGGALAFAIFFFAAALAVAGGHVLLLGLPLYAALRGRGPVAWPTAAAAGFVIGALPVQLLIDPQDSGRFGAGLVFGLCGLASALAFWRVLYRQ